MACKKNSRQVQLLISNKVDVRQKLADTGTSHNDQSVSSPRKQQFKGVYLQNCPQNKKQSYKICEAKTARTERRKIHNHS